jgi:hypothetical protein
VEVGFSLVVPLSVVVASIPFRFEPETTLRAVLGDPPPSRKKYYTNAQNCHSNCRNGAHMCVVIAIIIVSSSSSSSSSS